MKPSNEINVAMVLDTKPECNVLWDILIWPENVKEFEDSNNIVDNPNTIRQRFRSQTRRSYTVNIPGSDVPPFCGVEETWKSDPEFEVLTEDVEFVMAAAKRVTRSMNPLRRTWNRVTGRTLAAKAILSEIS